MKRTIYYPIVIVCILVTFGVLYFMFSSGVTTVILVRHAERLNSTDTTTLSEAGFERATKLAHVVGSSGISRIFVTQYVRTQQTAGPTAASLGVSPSMIPSGDIETLIDSIDANKGEVILLVGHSDTLPGILQELGISNPPQIGGNTFDNLFVVTKRWFGVKMTHLKYGNPT